MEAKLIDGKDIATKIKEELIPELKDIKAKGIIPRLEAVIVGENQGAKIYAGNQDKACKELSISYKLNELPESTSQDQLIGFIQQLNENPKVTGIILLMPVPSHINAREVQMKICPSKDVEGIHPFNIGKLVYGEAVIAPCTALAVMELLKSTNVCLKGKEVVIVGHSEIIGKPLTLLLLQSRLESPTPTICHIATKDLAFHIKRADILIVAVGKVGLITGDMLKEGAIVIDVGINKVDDKIVGDVVFDEAVKKASFITPVPGGVGPVTTAMLLKNTVEAAKNIGK
ncbi:MAG: bifunctional 5,10-methylenetetrahydrofolate dehydrogenase/5,10-methenyltetrahydrofolate cyclohydrolase [Candidatus Omnitrophica bacterium]|nr:bifunctional 5,10-methylenetetrahydrofolate dehydrogenase/5,10-methenyltetrahydrofolate cyclohydrolase [Candidatus Omnitrophota bacterium]MBU1048087.1 bifunctional 5,10-methylenetetrahydrofolate dehydrogenase/5,10-methenyltetrahydrofolate cyclohydrolase [Candidatus Omnitrophota bacterium]MBU1631414.1 bifunctional 5,10-methylenetetrahydrofolate dehydrogenase/5,10-methenyltetrahydrofolate cyclohydrolase [Candidatus Omnitrophota bacterium]MBU1767200.1 bifunctional 5,10-methylenetetrahydrofolate 